MTSDNDQLSRTVHLERAEGRRTHAATIALVRAAIMEPVWGSMVTRDLMLGRRLTATGRAGLGGASLLNLVNLGNWSRLEHQVVFAVVISRRAPCRSDRAKAVASGLYGASADDGPTSQGLGFRRQEPVRPLQKMWSGAGSNRRPSAFQLKRAKRCAGLRKRTLLTSGPR